MRPRVYSFHSLLQHSHFPPRLSHSSRYFSASTNYAPQSDFTPPSAWKKDQPPTVPPNGPAERASWSLGGEFGKRTAQPIQIPSMKANEASSLKTEERPDWLVHLERHQAAAAASSLYPMAGSSAYTRPTTDSSLELAPEEVETLQEDKRREAARASWFSRAAKEEGRRRQASGDEIRVLFESGRKTKAKSAVVKPSVESRATAVTEAGPIIETTRQRGGLAEAAKAKEPAKERGHNPIMRFAIWVWAKFENKVSLRDRIPASEMIIFERPILQPGAYIPPIVATVMVTPYAARFFKFVFSRAGDAISTRLASIFTLGVVGLLEWIFITNMSLRVVVITIPRSTRLPVSPDTPVTIHTAPNLLIPPIATLFPQRSITLPVDELHCQGRLTTQDLTNKGVRVRTPPSNGIVDLTQRYGRKWKIEVVDGVWGNPSAGLQPDKIKEQLENAMSWGLTRLHTEFGQYRLSMGPKAAIQMFRARREWRKTIFGAGTQSTAVDEPRGKM